MAALAPHLRLVDPTRQQCLRRRTHALAAREGLEERRRPRPVEALRIEFARDPLQCGDGGANLLEHASSRVAKRPGEAFGKYLHIITNVCSMSRGAVRQFG